MMIHENTQSVKNLEFRRIFMYNDFGFTRFINTFFRIPITCIERNRTGPGRSRRGGTIMLFRKKAAVLVIALTLALIAPSAGVSAYTAPAQAGEIIQANGVKYMVLW